MLRGVKLTALRRVFGQDGVIKGDEVIFFCPRHGAKSSRVEGQLSVNLVADWFNCWSCGFRGKSLIPLLKLRGNSPELQEYLQERESFLPKEIVLEKSYSPPTLPEGFRTLSTPSGSPYYRAALSYLEGRGLGMEDVLRWKLGYCEDGEFRYRIIVPSFDETGELNFVVGRAFYDNEYRYAPCPKNQCKDIVWNDYMIDWTRPVTITEGPFDAFIVQDNVTILQGTWLQKKLLRKIVLTGVDVYFAMDADAFLRQLKHMKLLLSYGIGCHYVDIKGLRKKDVGSMMKAEYREAHANAISIKNDLDLLKLRVVS